MGSLTWMSNWYGVSGTPSSQTFLRGDGTFAQVSSASIGTNYTDSVSSGTGINVTGTPGAPWAPVVALTPLTLSATYFSSLSAANLTAIPAAQLTGTITSATQDLITRLGTLVSGATGAGFTVALSTSTITGTLAAARLPSVYLGTTAVDLTRASAALSLADLSVTGGGTWNAGGVTSSGNITIAASQHLYYGGAANTNIYLRHRAANSDVIHSFDSGDFYLGDIAASTHNWYLGNTLLVSIASTGVVSFKNYAFPLADGTNDQVLTTNGSGSLTFTDKAGGGGGGITSLEGQTGATQVFTDDTNMTIVSAGNAHVLTWAGTLGVARGGTGLATLTANRIPYGNGTSAFQSSANLTFDGTTMTLAGNLVI